MFYNGECCDGKCGNLLDFEKTGSKKAIAQVAAVNPEICQMLKESIQWTTTTVATPSGELHFSALFVL